MVWGWRQVWVTRHSPATDPNFPLCMQPVARTCLEPSSTIPTGYRELAHSWKKFGGRPMRWDMQSNLASVSNSSRNDHLGPYPSSTPVDFDRGDPIELHSLFELPLQRARKVEVATPLLERLVVILQELQRRQEKGSLSSSSSARIKST